MNDGILHPIARVEPRSGYHLLIIRASGGQSTVDFTGSIERGGIWAALRDTAKFAQARVAYQGRVLEWPEPAGADGSPPIDVDADGLYEMACQQAARTGQLVSAGPDEGRAA
jgi:hypothetical protein